jgi:protein translocase subunit secA
MGVRGARPWAALPSANKGETSVSIVDRILRIGEGRTLKRLDAIATRVEALADSYADFTDAELKEVTVELKERYADGESLDDLLPEAFAAVCEAADRVLGMRPFTSRSWAAPPSIWAISPR